MPHAWGQVCQNSLSDPTVPHVKNLPGLHCIVVANGDHPLCDVPLLLLVSSSPQREPVGEYKKV